MGGDFSDGKVEDLSKMSRYYAQNGVTSFLATTMTLKEHTLLPAMEVIRDFVRPADGAKCAGIHLEGPFLGYAKRGAQAAENLHLPDSELFDRLNEASGGKVKLTNGAGQILTFNYSSSTNRTGQRTATGFIHAAKGVLLTGETALNHKLDKIRDVFVHLAVKKLTGNCRKNYLINNILFSLGVVYLKTFGPFNFGHL